MRFSHAERFGNMNLKNLKLKSNNYNFKVLWFILFQDGNA
jgi:hypothetical protein